MSGSTSPPAADLALASARATAQVQGLERTPDESAGAGASTSASVGKDRDRNGFRDHQGFRSNSSAFSLSLSESDVSAVKATCFARRHKSRSHRGRLSRSSNCNKNSASKKHKRSRLARLRQRPSPTPPAAPSPPAMRRASSAESLATQNHKVVPPKDPLLSVRKHFVAISSGTTQRARKVSDEVLASRPGARARNGHLIPDDNDGYMIPTGKATRVYSDNVVKTGSGTAAATATAGNAGNTEQQYTQAVANMPMYAEYMPRRSSPRQRVHKSVNWASDLADRPPNSELTFDYECGPYATANIVHSNDIDLGKPRDTSRSGDARSNRPLPPLPNGAGTSSHQNQNQNQTPSRGGERNAETSDMTCAGQGFDVSIPDMDTARSCLRSAAMQGERTKRKSFGFGFKDSLKPFWASLAACKSAGLSASCSTLSSDYGDAVRMREDYHRRDHAHLFSRKSVWQKAAQQAHATPTHSQGHGHGHGYVHSATMKHSSSQKQSNRVQKKARIKLPPSALKMPPFEQNVHIACETAIAADGTIKHLFASMRPLPLPPDNTSLLAPPLPPPPPSQPPPAATQTTNTAAAAAAASTGVYEFEYECECENAAGGTFDVLGCMMNSLSLRGGTQADATGVRGKDTKKKATKAAKGTKHHSNGYSAGRDEQWICYATFGPETTPKALAPHLGRSAVRTDAPANRAGQHTRAPQLPPQPPPPPPPPPSETRRSSADLGATPTLPAPPSSFYSAAQHAALMTISEDSDWCKQNNRSADYYLRTQTPLKSKNAAFNANANAAIGTQLSPGSELTASENDERHERLDVSPATSIGNAHPSASPSTSSPSASTNSLRSENDVKASRPAGGYRTGGFGIALGHANSLSLNRRQVLLQRLKSSDKTDKV